MKTIKANTKFSISVWITSISIATFILSLSVNAKESTYYSCEIKSVVSIGEDGKARDTGDTSRAILNRSQFVVQKETGDVHGGLINIIGTPTKKVLFDVGGRGNFFKIVWQFEKPLAPSILYLSIHDVQNSNILPPYLLTGIVQENFVTGFCR